MFNSTKRSVNYANVTATLALVFAMSGGALAARHYMINSTGQINPKVLKKLKGHPGSNGARGTQGREGALGKEGKEGPAGKEGREGKGGAAGKDGAVAGYSALQTSEIDLAGHASSVQIPGLSKALPAGWFIVSANLEVTAHSREEPGSAGVVCELVDTPTSGSPAVATSSWLSAVDVKVLSLGYFSVADLPLHLAVGTGVNASTVSLRCKVNLEGGKELKINALNGAIAAVQTIENR